MKKPIRANTGALRGWIDTGNENGGNPGVYDSNSAKLGYYNTSNDKTYSISEGYIGDGDQRMILLN